MQDFGRGLWPYRSFWNWGVATGVQDGVRIAVNVGARWTTGTGVNENGILLDGRLHKIMEDVRWDYDPSDWMRPWRVRAEATGMVDLTLEPIVAHRTRTSLGRTLDRRRVLLRPLARDDPRRRTRDPARGAHGVGGGIRAPLVSRDAFDAAVRDRYPAKPDRTVLTTWLTYLSRSYADRIGLSGLSAGVRRRRGNPVGTVGPEKETHAIDEPPL